AADIRPADQRDGALPDVCLLAPKRERIRAIAVQGELFSNHSRIHKVEAAIRIDFAASGGRARLAVLNKKQQAFFHLGEPGITVGRKETDESGPGFADAAARRTNQG